ncbi:MAG: AEC family transporter [Oceanospirillaceae bacterium]|nr:AEC family transporter [Oceanospirillaceae bacterium]
MWESIQALTPIIASIALFVALGWWAAASLFSIAQQQFLTKYVSVVLIPIWLFASAVSVDLQQYFSLTILLSYFMAAALLIFVLNCVIKQHKAALTLASSYSNTLYFSIPIIELVLGSGAKDYALPIIMFNTLFILTSYELAKQSARGKSLTLAQLHQIMISSVKNPIVVGLLLGLIINITLVDKITDELPSIVSITALIKTYSALPVLALALFSLGVSFQSLPRQKQSCPWLAVLLKMLVFPMLVYIFAHYLFALTNLTVYVLVILAASPLAINSYFFVNNDKKAQVLIGRSIIQSSLLSVISIPVWILILNMLLPISS